MKPRLELVREREHVLEVPHPRAIESSRAMALALGVAVIVACVYTLVTLVAP